MPGITDVAAGVVPVIALVVAQSSSSNVSSERWTCRPITTGPVRIAYSRSAPLVTCCSPTTFEASLSPSNGDTVKTIILTLSSEEDLRKMSKVNREAALNDLVRCPDNSRALEHVRFTFSQSHQGYSQPCLGKLSWMQPFRRSRRSSEAERSAISAILGSLL